MINLTKIKSNHPNEGKQLHDLENRTFKLLEKVHLKIEAKLFEEMRNQNRQGRFPEGYFAKYEKEIQKS